MSAILGEPLIDLRTALQLAVGLSRYRPDLAQEPEPGDLVIETTWLRRQPDPDAIGWLVAHGEAPYAEDGTGPTREVWDITPLSGAVGVGSAGELYQRWENASFVKVPDRLVVRLGLVPPDGWRSLFA